MPIPAWAAEDNPDDFPAALSEEVEVALAAAEVVVASDSEVAAADGVSVAYKQF